MTSYTWTREVCTNCCYAQKTRGLHRSVGRLCFYCRQPTMQWQVIAWGPEKYAQGRTGHEVNPAVAHIKGYRP